jgi:hypothetical protein
MWWHYYPVRSKLIAALGHRDSHWLSSSPAISERKMKHFVG